MTLSYTKALAFLLVLPAAAQVVTPAFPDVPGSTSVYAGEGDLTYCVATPLKGSVPQFSLTCRRAGLTYFTATIIKATGIFTSGDLCWSFVFDPVVPGRVRVQVSANVRDKNLLSVALNYGNLIQEFQVGEAVHDWPGHKSGIVEHWVHTQGSVIADFRTDIQFGAQLTLKDMSGPAFAVGDQIIGTTGSSGFIGAVDAITSNKLQSAFDVQWSAAPAAAENVFVRAWRGIFRRQPK